MAALLYAAVIVVFALLPLSRTMDVRPDQFHSISITLVNTAGTGSSISAAPQPSLPQVSGGRADKSAVSPAPADGVLEESRGENLSGSPVSADRCERSGSDVSASGAALSGSGSACSTASSTGPSSDGTSGSTLRSAFLAWLDESIRKKLVYPARARRRGIEGLVELGITVDADGALRRVQVTRTSGSAILDTDALELLRSLFPSSSPPGVDFADTVRIRYIFERE